MWEYLRNVTSAPKWKCMKDFVVIPPGPGVNVSLLPDANEYRYYSNKYYQSLLL